MKKALAILAVAVLCSTFAFADAPGSLVWSGNAAGNYTANVACLPSLTGGSLIVLGDFFNNQTWTGSEVQTFTLTGGGNEQFGLTFSASGDLDVIWQGNWSSTPQSVMIEGQCGSYLTFTYTLTSANFTGVTLAGTKTFTAGMTATLTAY